MVIFWPRAALKTRHSITAHQELDIPSQPSACPDLPEARNYTAGSRRIRTEIAQPIATQAAQPTNGEYLPKSTPKPNIRPKGWSFS